MNNNKLETIINLFQGYKIRSIWDSEKEDYYFSVVDVISALAEPKDPSDYWTTLKRRLVKEEKSEIPTNCRVLKMKSDKDGKLYNTDTLDTKGIFRLIESIPSRKAEPFKLWLAKLGNDKIDEVFDPSKGIEQMIDFYLMKGFDFKWIENRIKSIVDRKKLTYAWKESGIEKPSEFAILTNISYVEWAGMTANEYKTFKGLRKESLRDNMSDIEVALTDLSEVATKTLIDKHKPYGLNKNKIIAKQGGHAAKAAKEDLEESLGESVITNQNNLNYKNYDYIELDN